MANLSRFSVQESATQAPGHCLICGGISGPFIHTGNSIKFHGVVLICQGCVVEMAEVLNLPREINKVEEVISHEQHDHIVSLLNRRFDDLCDIVGRVPLRESGAAGSGDSKSSAGTKSEADKSSGKQDPVGVSSDNSGGFEFSATGT